MHKTSSYIVQFHLPCSSNILHNSLLKALQNSNFQHHIVLILSIHMYCVDCTTACPILHNSILNSKYITVGLGPPLSTMVVPLRLGVACLPRWHQNYKTSPAQAHWINRSATKHEINYCTSHSELLVVWPATSKFHWKMLILLW